MDDWISEGPVHDLKVASDYQWSLARWNYVVRRNWRVE